MELGLGGMVAGAEKYYGKRITAMVMWLSLVMFLILSVKTIYSIVGPLLEWFGWELFSDDSVWRLVLFGGGSGFLLLTFLFVCIFLLWGRIMWLDCRVDRRLKNLEDRIDQLPEGIKPEKKG